MKKKFVISIILILFLGVGLYAYCSHFVTWQLVETDMSEVEILEEMPDIEITDKDYALERLVISLYKEQDALSSLSQQLESAVTLSDMNVYENTIMLTLFEGEDKRIEYSFSVDGSFPIHKTISIYEKKGEDLADWKCLGIYENDSWGIRKYVNKRKWF